MIVNSFNKNHCIFDDSYSIVKAIELDRDWAKKNPVDFIKKYLGVELYDLQEQIVESVRDNRITAVKSANGIGKTFVDSVIASWFLMSYENSIVLTTAPTFRQVKSIMFAYIHKLVPKLKQIQPIIANDVEIKVNKGWFCLGMATKDEDKFQGWHADHILIIADEGSGIQDNIYQAIDSVMVTGQTARLLTTGNPLRKKGRFHRLFDTKGVKKFSISSFDTPNFKGISGIRDLMSRTQDPPITHTYLTSPAAVRSQIEEYGEDSPFVQSRVLAQFPDQEINVLIPLNYVEQAVDRFSPKQSPPIFGCDPSRFGDDATALIRRVEHCITDVFKLSNQQRISLLAKEIAPIIGEEYGLTYIDSIGLGAGLVDDLVVNERIEEVYGVNVSMKSSDKKKFYNLRAELWWYLRQLFYEGKISIPNNKKLIEQLSDIYYSFKDSKIIIESKEDIKKRTGESPDIADALMISYAGGQVEVIPEEVKEKELELKEGKLTPIRHEDDDPFGNLDI